jgi:hypothetical protein
VHGSPDEARQKHTGSNGRHGTGACADGCAVKGRRPHGQHLDGLGRLDRGHRITGIDRTHKRVGRLDGDHIADGLRVQKRGNSRKDVLSKCGGWANDMGKATRLLASRDEGRKWLRQRMLKNRFLSQQNRLDLGNLGGLLSNRFAVLTSNQDGKLD